jgi:hypothetical protein
MEPFSGVVSAGLAFCCFHPSIVQPNPVNRVSATLSTECQWPSNAAFGGLKLDATMRCRLRLQISGHADQVALRGRFLSNDRVYRQILAVHDANSRETFLLDSPNERGMKGSSSTISPMNQIDTTHRRPTCQRQRTTTDEPSPRSVRRLSQNPRQDHTHVQQVAAGQLVNRLR